MISRFSLPISIRKDAANSALAISLVEAIINPTLFLFSSAMGANSAGTPVINSSPHKIWNRDRFQERTVRQLKRRRIQLRHGRCISAAVRKVKHFEKISSADGP